MRGERDGRTLLAVTPEAFVPDDHPLRRIKPLVDAGAAVDGPRSRPSRGSDRPLLGAQRAPVLRAAALRWFLDLSRGRALQRHDLLQEPRASAGGGGGACLLRRGGGRGGPPPAALGRPLQRGRDVAGGVGLAQELPTNRIHRHRRVGATRRWTSGAGVAPRDARLAHGRRGAALPQGTAAGGEAALSGPRPQREPSRAGGGRRAERGERLRRAGSGPADAGACVRWGPTATTRATSWRRCAPAG